MSLFFVDSGCDLGFEQIKKLGVESLNLNYAINDKVFEFNSEFDYDKFYSKFKKGVCVSASPMTEDEYISVFEPCLKQGDDIVYVHSGDKIMNLDNLFSARNKLLEKYTERKFELINSSNFSIGQGLVSFECALLYRKGFSATEIYERSFDIRNNYAIYFACDSLEQLSNNNLVDSNLVAGTALNIKPILTLDIDGNIELVDKVSGRKKAITKLIEICRQKGKNIADNPIGIVYSSDINLAEELKNKIIELFGEETTIFFERMSPSNAAIVGNNMIGLAFSIVKKKL